MVLISFLLPILSLLTLTSAARYTPLSNNASCIPNYNLNWVAGSTGGKLLGAGLQYPLCASDFYHHGPSTPTWTYMYGGYDTRDESTLYATTDGFQTLAYPARTDNTIGPHRMGLGAVLANGNLIFVGGENGTTAASAEAKVWMSSDRGQSFTVSASNTPFDKYEGQLVTIPMTNTVILIGGYNQAGSQTNDVWMSTDGAGAVWTRQTAASPLPTNALAGSVALYDNKYVNPSLYSSPNSTILFYLEYSAGDYWMSYDHGRTWSAAYVYPFSTAANSIGHRNRLLFTADQDNYIYMTGMYNEPDSFVWMSPTKGQTWSILQQTMSIPGLPTSLQYQWAKYNCMSMQYSNDTKSKQLVIYGYQIYLSDGTVWQSLVGTLNTPMGQPGYGVLPNATITAALPTGTLPSTLYPSCAYNVHTLTSNPRLFIAGGTTGVSNNPTNGAYISANNGATFTAATTSAFTTPVYSAGSAILSDGRILLIGGQTNTSASSFSSSVYVSSDNGATFTLVTANAAFGARTNFATCVMPGTNTVAIVGGSYNNNGTATTDNDIWVSTNGGSTWTLTGVLPVNTLAGTCVFLYDNSAVSSIYNKPYSTLLVVTHTSRLYRSYDMGATFDASPSAVTPGPSGYQFVPFSTQFDATATRYQTEIVADYDNYLWATGGLNIYDNGLYFSGDIGFTWYRLKQVNTVNATASYIQASTSCLGLSYVQSGSSYVKTLSLYGGVGVLFDSRQNFSAITFTVDSAPTFIPSVTGTATNTTLTAVQANAAQLWCMDPVQPSIQWQGVTSSDDMAFAQYPLCAADVHQGNPSLPTAMYMYGGYVSSANTGRMYSTLDGFQTINASHSDTTVGVRRMGSAAVLLNGDVVLMGGQTGTTAATADNNVYISHDHGQTFSLLNNTYPGKYEAQLLSIPYTNTLVLIGGYDQTGAETDDVYVSYDGGATWLLQTSNSPLPTNALAAAVAMYDSKYVNPSLYSSPNSTIAFFLEYSSGKYWMSYDLGRTWSTYYYYPMSTSFTSITHRDWMEMACDHDNILYALGEYNNPDNTVWYSPTKGQTFYPLQVAPSAIPSISAYTQMMWAQYGCVAVQYGKSRVTGQTLKQLVVYGYYTYLSDGTQYSALVGNLPNIPLSSMAPNPPTATLSSSVPTSAVNNGQSPSCAYNVHARNGVMMGLGGLVNTSDITTLNSAFTVSTNSFASTTANNLYSYNLSSIPPVSAGGLALLNNGNLIQYGGQTGAGVYSNTVYSSSTTTGISFTPLGQAAWSARANFITCTMPFSNLVMVIGGVTAAGNVNDIWSVNYDVDGTWRQPTTNEPWTDAGVLAGTCVFMYDSNRVQGLGSTQPYSTLLVFTHTNRYYRSVTAGATWAKQPNPYSPLAPNYQIAPWSTQYDNSNTRQGIEVVVDFDNHLYAMAGTGIWDNTMWWSQDQAMTWYRMKQVNTVNSAYFIQASTSCLGLNYVRNGGQTGNYSKTLVLYGGNVQFDDGSKVGALTITLSEAVTFLPNNSAAVAFNAQPVIVSSSAAPRPSSSSSSSAAPRPSSSSSAPTASPTSPTSTPQPTTSTPQPATSQPSPTAPPAQSTAVAGGGGTSDSTSSDGLSNGAIAGIVVGSVIGGMLLCLLIFAIFVAHVRGKGKKGQAEAPSSYEARRMEDGSSVVGSTNDTNDAIEMQ